jgi:chemotaxis signal transduction protein
MIYQASGVSSAISPDSSFQVLTFHLPNQDFALEICKVLLILKIQAQAFTQSAIFRLVGVLSSVPLSF